MSVGKTRISFSDGIKGFFEAFYMLPFGVVKEVHDGINMILKGNQVISGRLYMSLFSKHVLGRM